MRCKFKLLAREEGNFSRENPETGVAETVPGVRCIFSAVPKQEDDPESATYNGLTPNGRFEVTVVNPTVVEELKKLQLMQNVYIDVSWPTN